MALTQNKIFQMRATAEFYRKLDEWRRHQPDMPARAEAVRRLVERAIEADKKAPDQQKPDR